MNRAFVVRLGSRTESAHGRFEGWVEEVDTGKELKFRSAEELLKFLGQRFDEALRRQRETDLAKKPETVGARSACLEDRHELD